MTYSKSSLGFLYYTISISKSPSTELILRLLIASVLYYWHQLDTRQRRGFLIIFLVHITLYQILGFFSIINTEKCF